MPDLNLSKSRALFLAFRLHTVSSLQGKPPTKKAKVLHKAAWSAKIGAFLHSQGTGQLADGTPTGQDGKTAGTDAQEAGWVQCQDWGGPPRSKDWKRWPARKCRPRLALDCIFLTW